jgi:hypothetical protein
LGRVSLRVFADRNEDTLAHSLRETRLKFGKRTSANLVVEGQLNY